MEFRCGRSNLALTVFVPYDCKNSCRFCTTKKSYEEKPANLEAVADEMRGILYYYSFPITDVVFTGGEPMENVAALKRLIEMIEPLNKKVYINTTFTKKNLQEFIDLVNGNDTIQGVNISRHGETFERDAYLLDDIAPDCEIAKIKKPVRINCLDKGQNLKRIIDRWNGKDVELSIRRDYREQMTDDQLHNPYDPTPMMLIDMGFSYVGKTQCNVCDTTIFEREGMIVRYHKGLERSSILHGNTLEFNDLIIDQNGNFAYDWKESNERIVQEMKKEFNPFARIFLSKPISSNHTQLYCGGRNSYCGGSGC